MKKFAIENGRQVMYITRDDLETMRKIEAFINPELFEEDSILKDECDTDGYYRVTDTKNVNYLKFASYIPHYSYLLKFDSTQLSDMLNQALDILEKIELVFATPCDRYLPMNEEEKEFIRGVDPGIERSLVEKALAMDPAKEDDWMVICDIAGAIRIEYEHYAMCIKQAMNIREDMEVEEASTRGPNPDQTDDVPKKKRFSLMDLFGFIGK